MIELWVKSIILEDFKMDKYTYNEQNGLWYELQEDYYLSYLKLPEEKRYTSDVKWDTLYTLNSNICDGYQEW